MEEGIVKKRFADRQYGFIVTDSGDSAFFHSRECTSNFDELEEGVRVQFDLEQNPKGLTAIRVQKKTEPKVEEPKGETASSGD